MACSYSFVLLLELVIEYWLATLSLLACELTYVGNAHLNKAERGFGLLLRAAKPSEIRVVH